MANNDNIIYARFNHGTCNAPEVYSCCCAGRG